MGFVPSWEHLALCRVLLGAFEVLNALISPRMKRWGRTLGRLLSRFGVCYYDLVRCLHCIEQFLLTWSTLSIGPQVYSTWSPKAVGSVVPPQFAFLDVSMFLVPSFGIWRLGAFYLVSILTGGFSPIFAYVLTLPGRKRNIPVWAWIFVRFKSTETTPKSWFQLTRSLKERLPLYLA